MSENVTYQRVKSYIRVYLGGKKVGEIRGVEGGFQYFPKGQKKGGDVYSTIAEAKISLEG